MDKCGKCSMPMKEDEDCSCNPKTCYHCCHCNANCVCGCKKKEVAEKEHKSSGCKGCGK